MSDTSTRLRDALLAALPIAEEAERETAAECTRIAGPDRRRDAPGYYGADLSRACAGHLVDALKLNIERLTPPKAP